MVTALTPYQFRFCPASYIHSDHLLSEWLAVLSSLPEWRNSPRLNGLLLTQFDLHVDYELPTGLGNIALLEQSCLEQLLTWLGALLHGQAIRHCLMATELRHLHDSLGKEGHRFCLNYLDIIIGNWPTGWQRSLPPEINANYFRTSALQFWLTAMEPPPIDFAKRLSLRLPAYENLAAWPISQAERPLAQALCLKLAKQVNTECYHLLK
ncbi:Yop proteins translocation protein K [Photorhabdus bodei]|uniref:YscK family type III secretion system sorting platform protein n=1 Tax=Photorhabdus bodei TaxID=2029681 RepID=A0ABX0AHK0_9GAMM|nr:Yop proteins translocation protein K [Photorhabdus bodei]NDK98221.1 YscK family type III secretion system sorting platform protein [Photorhabdus bodei]NDL02471.1 YscK family type III secretion system sorting platform protein [Photorhabdus bodei]NDL06545.1 YscK family type III secretion system sorting platform protein [Photorhabdus bodei]